LSELFKVQEYKTLITALNTNCTVEALSKDRSLDEGFRAIYNSIDEIHQHKDNSIYKALYNGTRALDETLSSMTTTRGRDLNSFCYEMDSYCLNILNGTVTAEDFFVDIYALDDGDDPFDEKNWIKTNPLLARTEGGLETLRTDAQTARDMGGMELADYLTKCQNMWVQQTDNQYINVEAFRNCGSGRKLDYFAGRECYAGLDLSSGGDLTTLALEIPFVEDGRQKYYLWSHSFMPRARLQEHIKSDLAPYDVWEKENLITVTGGMGDYKNDYLFIIKKLEEIITKYNLKLKAIGYDSHNADGFLADLDIFGCPLVEIKQSARFLNDATSDLQLLIKQGDVEYDKSNGLFIWSFVNAKVVSNSFGEIKVDKENGNAKSCRRIDPVDAAIDAHVIGMKQIETTVDVDSSINKFLEWMK
jgi:phage terminase large subunit-like protein